MRHQFTLTRTQKLTESLCILSLLAMVALVLLSWNKLPDQIPTHYGADGQINGWGAKAQLWVVPGCGLLCYVSFFIPLLMPMEKWNMPIKLTDRNRTQAYRLSVSMILAVKLETLLICLWTTAAQCTCTPVGGLFLVCSIAAPMLTLVIYLVRFSFLPR